MEDAVTNAEREALFAQARRAAAPTENDRRQVRTALARRLAATATATVTTTAVKAAASGASTANVAGAAGISALAKTLVAVVAVAVVAGGAAIATTTSSAPVIPVTRVVSAPRAAAPSLASPPGSVARVTPQAEPPHAAPSPVQASAPTSTSPSLGPSPTATLRSGPRRDPIAVAAEPRPSAFVAPAPAPASMATPPLAPVAPLAPTASPSDVAAEIGLMADMQSALRDGDARRVLSLVGEHDRRFPASAWAPEREGARVLAQCMEAAPHEARPLGQAFLDAHPLSPLSGRVRATCGLDLAGR
jgi:hypothetical protein